MIHKQVLLVYKYVSKLFENKGTWSKIVKSILLEIELEGLYHYERTVGIDRWKRW